MFVDVEKLARQAYVKGQKKLARLVDTERKHSFYTRTVWWVSGHQGKIWISA